MLNLEFLKNNPDIIKDNLIKRNQKEKLIWIDELLNYDLNYKKLLQTNQQLRRRRNEITEEINQLKKQGKNIDNKIQEVKSLPLKIKQTDQDIQDLKNKIDNCLIRLPNLLDKTVPIGKDENDNLVLKTWGEKPKFDFELKPHGDLLQQLGLVHFTNEISGHGFYYLIGEIAMMELALINFTIELLTKKKYTLIEPPLMMRSKPYSQVTNLEEFKTTMYKIQDEDLFLIATSEHPIAAMFMNKTLDEKDLPIKFVGLSPCFRKELGSHSIDTRGLFRVHQFNKVEQFIFCNPKDSTKFHEELIKNTETIFQKLELPYRIVNVCSGELGDVASKKYDIEAWFPRENCYREVGSCSNCTTYQSARLDIKYLNKINKESSPEKSYIHSLNSTAIATSRAIRAIVENYQQKDGIAIPKVLQKYMGKKIIQMSSIAAQNLNKFI